MSNEEMMEEQRTHELGPNREFEFDKEWVSYLLKTISRRVSFMKNDEFAYMLKDKKVDTAFDQPLWSKNAKVRVKISMEKIEL